MTPLTPETEVTLLLCGTLSTSRTPESIKPLTPLEYSTFIRLLDQHQLALSELLSPNGIKALARETEEPVVSRATSLLERGASLAIAVERWESRGIWVIDRTHPAYPEPYRRRLRDHAPPLLFGAGDLSLLSREPVVGIIGSRDIDAASEQFASDAGRFAALDGATVVTGGARGTDRIAIGGALDGNGYGIAILPGDLERASTSGIYRDAIIARRLVLATPFHPNARFSVGNAMGRNRHIYCLSDIAIVVNAAKGSGGTWTGAVECLKAGWTPVYARQGDGVSEGNQALLPFGALPVEHGVVDDSVRFREWLSTAFAEAATPREPTVAETVEPQQLDLFSPKS